MKRIRMPACPGVTNRVLPEPVGSPWSPTGISTGTGWIRPAANGTAVGGVDYTCLLHRFEVVPSYVVYSAPAADGHVTETSRGRGHFVPDATNNSAIIWFFSPDNWEVLVKMPSGTCALSHTYWLFAAATTNLHYKLVVTDIGSGIGPEERGQQRIYFNYSGPPAPAIIDTTSFTACVP